MSKSVARSSAQAMTVGGWPDATQMMVDANRIQEGVITGKLGPEEARLMVSNMRNAIALIALMMDHAKASKRIKEGDTKLEGFSFSK